jgi:hypothetical protein
MPFDFVYYNNIVYMYKVILCVVFGICIQYTIYMYTILIYSTSRIYVMHAAQFFEQQTILF